MYWAIYGKRFEEPVCVCFFLGSPVTFSSALITWLQKLDVIMGIANEERVVMSSSITNESEKGAEI